MKKHFLILMLMALLPMAGFALSFNESKFYCLNIDYGTAGLPAVQVVDTYVEGTHYQVVADKFYNEAKEEIAATSLATTSKGKYYRKVEGLNDYEGQTVYVDFWINGIDVTIDFTDGLTSVFGAADAEITYTLSGGYTKEQLGLTVKRATGTDAGEYAYSFEWTNENYALTRDAGDAANKYTITAKPIGGTATITAWQGDVTYTGNDIIGVYTVKDGEKTLTAGTAGGTGDYYVSAAHNAGDYTPTITFQNNYSGSIAVAAEKKFTVKPAPIVVGLEDLEVVYDKANHKTQDAGALATAKKFTYSGIVGDDLATAATIKDQFTAPTSVVAKTDAINAGDYELTITGGSTNTATNYVFASYLPGKLTIKPADLTITAVNANKAIGDDDPKFTFTSSIGGLTITGVTFTRAEGETAGNYDITPIVDAIVIKDGDDVVTDNYEPTAVKGTLTIGKTQIYVTIKDNNKFYGEADPDFDYSVIGLSKEALGKVTITREKAGTAEGEAVGAYSLTANVDNPDASKYLDPIVANGIFTIKKAELTFVMPAQNLAIGKKVTDLSKAAITVTGIKKEADKADNGAALYELSFNGVSVDTEEQTYRNETIADGILATLTAEAQANYVVIGDNKRSVDVDVPEDEYEAAVGKIIVGTGGGLGVDLDGTDADYEGVIKARAGETVPTVSVKITGRNARKINATDAEHPWKAETWNTMVLPFEVTVAELSTQLGYAIVNLVNPEKTTETNVQFKLEMQTIPANTPFCVKTSEDIPEGAILTFVNKLIVDGGEYPSVPASSEAIGFKFVGAYKSLTVDKTTPNYHFLRGDNANWAHFGASSANSWTVLPYDAYIDQSGAASAPELTFTFQEIDGTTTAIKAVDADVVSNRTLKEGWYTIGGMKLQSAPTQKGVYINNGKKIIVK